METLDLPESASINTEPELDLARWNTPPPDWWQSRAATAGTALFHLVVTVALFSYKESPYAPPPPERMLVRHVTPLFTPKDLTQKAPNKAPLAKELTLESIAPRPTLRAPSPAAAGQQAKALPTPPPPTPQAPPAPKPVVLEAPKIESPVQGVQTAQIPTGMQMPSQEPPKIAFQDVAPRPSQGTGKPTGLIEMPTNSVQEAVRNLSRTGGIPGTQAVGDGGADLGGLGPGLNLPPSAGRPRSNLELKSDPMGVDFRPYMMQVLAAVRRNWFAVYPEAARLGQRGQVILQFAVAKQGAVVKVVFNGASGAKALDQSAVAAISASNPLPPLPPEFRGDRIVLQMTFLYNMPR